MNRLKTFIAALAITAVVIAPAASTQASAAYLRWSYTSVSFHLNPQNYDLDADATETAFKIALATWNAEGSDFAYSYGGRVADTAIAFDGRNVALFRSDSDATAIARTYTWSESGAIVDADVVFSDERFSFSTRSIGCLSTAPDAAYLEDIGSHELGHALGLGDSPLPSAVMVAAIPNCTAWHRTLDADDLLNLRGLYGTPASTDTPPVTDTALSVDSPHPPSVPSTVAPRPSSSSSSTLETSLAGNSRLPAADPVKQPAQPSPSLTTRPSATPSLSAEVPTVPQRAAARAQSIHSAMSPAVDLTAPPDSQRAQTSDWRDRRDLDVGALPPPRPESTNSPPSIIVLGPINTRFTEGATILFTGTATDREDGKLTAGLTWTSSVIGYIGAGGTFTKALPAGTHVITAIATDTNGATSSQELTIHVARAGGSPMVSSTPPATTTTMVSTPRFNASGYTVGKSPRVDVTWSGFAARTLDVFRNGIKVATTTNDGSWTDKSISKGLGPYAYRVCASATPACTREVSVTF